MKKIYITPEVEIIQVETAEVIAASPFQRKTQFNGPIGTVTNDSEEEPQPGGSFAKSFSPMDDTLDNIWDN